MSMHHGSGEIYYFCPSSLLSNNINNLYSKIKNKFYKGINMYNKIVIILNNKQELDVGIEFTNTTLE